MRPEHAAVSSAILAIAAIVIVGGAAGAYVFYSGGLGGAGPSTSSKTASTTSSAHSSTSTSSSTSMASDSSSSPSTDSTASTSSYTTTSCTSTSNTNTGSFGAFNFTTMFRTYSEMALFYNTTSSGRGYDVTSEYLVVSANETTTRVNITTSSGLSPTHYTAWVLKNGTASAVKMEVSGFTFNYTGNYAELYFQSAMSTFLMESAFSDPSSLAQLTGTQYVHLSGNGTTMIGPSRVAYANYTANSLPLDITSCDSSSSYTKYFVQTGVVEGTQGALITQLTIVGTQTYNGHTSEEGITLLMTSVTKA